MINGEAMGRLLQMLGAPPRRVELRVEEFHAAQPAMSCVAVCCYAEPCEGLQAGLAAWADVKRDPVIYLAWEWVELRDDAVGMWDPQDVATNVALIDSAGKDIGRVKRETEMVLAAHGWNWWTEVVPSRICPSRHT